MVTEATVISVSGEFAVVESHRKAACDGCHKNAEGGCSICTLAGGDATVRLKVKNKSGARVGDRVVVSTESRRVLGYAWLVFLMPIVLAGVCYSVGFKIWQDEMAAVLASIGGMVISFAGVGIYSRLSVSKRCDAEIVDIIEDNNINE